MALATQCPHCHTTFKVAQDQLKLRAGLVRCGTCKQIFNGIEHLLPPEEAAPTAPVTSAQDITPNAKPAIHAAPDEPNADITVAPSVESTKEKLSSVEPQEDFKFANAEAIVTPVAPVEHTDHNEADPLGSITLIDFTHAADDPEHDRDAALTSIADHDPNSSEQAMEDLQSELVRARRKASALLKEQKEVESNLDTKDDQAAISLEDDEPGFVRKGRRRQRIGRALRLFMGIGSFVLLACLLLQGIYVFRDQIAARFPSAKPLLVQACVLLDCRMGLPAQVDAVSIESSELQALTPEKNSFVFIALLRNHSATAQAWPNIELTLNDANEQPVARRVFTPRDYLPAAQNVSNGFEANAEQSIKLFLDLSQLKASGYRVYLFYP
jgi:predicted Zn finger-like uncharacterized protein